MDDKPKTALDWIYWAREQKGDAAPPAAEPPAKPVASPTEVDATSAPSQRVEVAPAASAEPVVSEQAPVQAPPALPTDETVEETAGCGAIDKDLEDFEDSENLPDVDDFDRLMADAAVFESSDDPAPTPQAVEPQLPAASNSTVFIPAHSAYAFAASDFNSIEADGRELTYVEIIALAGDGSLRFDHVDITMGQKIAKADIDAGRLTFIPKTDHSSVSHDSFLYKVHDGTSCSRVAYTMTIKALPVDD